MVEGVRKRGRPIKQLLDNVTEWTKMDINDLINVVHYQDGWIKCVSKSSELIPNTISESRD